MSQKKKVVVTTNKKVKATQSTIKTAKSKIKTDSSASTLIFGKENYKWVGIGIALIAIGMLLMIGGFNEDPAIWDESKIYGFRRTVLAPIVILSGLAVEIYAIFK